MLNANKKSLQQNCPRRNAASDGARQRRISLTNNGVCRKAGAFLLR